MNLDDFIANFHTLARAPGGVDRLRELILQLAVQGKLVPQDPDDEPASVLLERIGKEKASEPITDAVLPPGWAWSSISRLGVLMGGGTPSKRNPQFWSGEIPWVSPKDMKQLYISDSQDHITELAIENSSTKLVPTGALLMVTRGMILAHSFPVALTRREVTINQDMKALVLHESAMCEYLLRCIRGLRSNIIGLVERSSHGTCRLPTGALTTYPIPIPPLAEQHRIVARVDELMALCDELEARQNAEEETLRETTASALDALLNAADAEDFEQAWARVHEHFDAMFDTPESIEGLRQAVLQLAVQGKLVAQDPNDEPASMLLERIGTEKAFEPITDTALPRGWAWSSISRLGALMGGGTPSKRNPQFWSGEIPWVSPKDMKQLYIWDAQDHITELAVEKSSTKLVPTGALLMVTRGMILAHSFPVALTRREVTINQDMKALVLHEPAMCEYLLRCMRGLRSNILGLVERSSHGTCRLPTGALTTYPIPIPPLAEQHRIVARVDELMALCDELEARLRAARDTSEALAAAMVHHFEAATESDIRSGAAANQVVA